MTFQKLRSICKLTPEEQERANSLLAEYLARPQHKSRMNGSLLGALTAAARRQAKHGNPPNYRSRSSYRAAKGRRRNNELLRLYGDPRIAKPVPMDKPPKGPSPIHKRAPELP